MSAHDRYHSLSKRYSAKRFWELKTEQNNREKKKEWRMSVIINQNFLNSQLV